MESKYHKEMFGKRILDEAVESTGLQVCRMLPSYRVQSEYKVISCRL